MKTCVEEEIHSPSAVLLQEEAEENWRGQNEIRKSKLQKRKPNYLEGDPTIMSCNLSSMAKCRIVGHLKNETFLS